MIVARFQDYFGKFSGLVALARNTMRQFPLILHVLFMNENNLGIFALRFLNLKLQVCCVSGFMQNLAHPKHYSSSMAILVLSYEFVFVFLEK